MNDFIWCEEERSGPWMAAYLESVVENLEVVLGPVQKVTPR
jgi:hypothetical protein